MEYFIVIKTHIVEDSFEWKHFHDILFFPREKTGYKTVNTA